LASISRDTIENWISILSAGERAEQQIFRWVLATGYRVLILNILFIGDIFGRPGRTIVKERLSDLVKQYSADLIIANGENAAAGFGITPQLAEELFELGIGVMTTGNHVWDKRELIEYFQMADGNPHSPARRLLRPANFPDKMPGWGVYEGKKNGTAYAVMNLQGRVFMGQSEDPFRFADQLLENIKAKVVLVDFHAEATSEKVAFGWYLDGRVTAVIGTHTHIPTADETVLPKGTAYITDVGMTGPYDSVIGVKKEIVVDKFLSGMPARFEAASGDVRLCAVVVECDEKTGRAKKMERVTIRQ
jgi:2',3'-cyclic-nucleotide 2'-phosphodiesterase